MKLESTSRALPSKATVIAIVRAGSGPGMKRASRRMPRVVLPHPSRLALACLCLVTLAGLTLLDPGIAAAQKAGIQQGPELMQDGGRQLGVQDWIRHLPLAMGMALFVIVVDAFVIFKFILGRREAQ